MGSCRFCYVYFNATWWIDKLNVQFIQKNHGKPFPQGNPECIKITFRATFVGRSDWSLTRFRWWLLSWSKSASFRDPHPIGLGHPSPASVCPDLFLRFFADYLANAMLQLHLVQASITIIVVILQIFKLLKIGLVPIQTSKKFSSKIPIAPEWRKRMKKRVIILHLLANIL